MQRIDLDTKVVKRGNKSYCLALPKRLVANGSLTEHDEVTIQIRKKPAEGTPT